MAESGKLPADLSAQSNAPQPSSIAGIDHGLLDSEMYQGLPRDCTICQHIMRGLLTPYSYSYEVDLGTAGDILFIDCSVHTPLFAHLKDRQPKYGKITPKSRLGLFKTKTHTSLKTLIKNEETGMGILDTLELVRNFHNFGRGLILDPCWIDSSLPKAWKDCLSEGTPTWLIDVRNQHLVPGSPEMAYVSLSYERGKTDEFKASKNLLSQLQELNAFQRKDLKSQIPGIILDAIQVTRLLDGNYLWVDSLCIAQDREDMKFIELNKIAAIYVNSVVTIIAAENENADSGLKGFTQPRDFQQRIMSFGDEEKVIRPVHDGHERFRSSFYNRGWTFQEYLFSKRRLIFQDQIVRWECGKRTWPEDIIHTNGPESNFNCNWMDAVVNGYPSLSAYGQMLLEYNKRKFTYAEDALPAITGLLSMPSQKYECGLLCGLPDMYFEAALNWQPWVGDLMRRNSSHRSAASESLTLLPSWSWIGWEGLISGDWRGDQDYLKKGKFTTPLYTFPITEWYTTDVPVGGTRRRIMSKFLHERDVFKDHLKRSLPPGWTRHEHDPEASIGEPDRYDGIYEYPPPDNCGSHWYTHESVPDAEFWYPIPIPAPNTEAIDPNQTQYLFCDTRRAFLYAKFDPNNKYTGRKYRNSVWLRDETGTWMGVLNLHSHDDLELFTVDSALGKHIELVAISRGHVPDSLRVNAPMEMDYEERPKGTSTFYEFYNVLWVEWENGIAYRKASGRVMRDAWEKLGLEPLSLVLG